MAEMQSEPNEDVELPEELAAELKNFIDRVGGIERAKEIFGDIENEEDELEEAA